MNTATPLGACGRSVISLCVDNHVHLLARAALIAVLTALATRGSNFVRRRSNSVSPAAAKWFRAVNAITARVRGKQDSTISNTAGGQRSLEVAGESVVVGRQKGEVNKNRTNRFKKNFATRGARVQVRVLLGLTLGRCTVPACTELQVRVLAGTRLGRDASWQVLAGLGRCTVPACTELN